MSVVDYSPSLGSLSLRDYKDRDLDLTVHGPDVEFSVFVPSTKVYESREASVELGLVEQEALVKWFLVRMTKEERDALMQEVEAESK